MTRAEEYQEVRRLLGRPKHQRPDADLIIAQLFRQEQLMLNRLNGTGKAWTTATLSITTVIGTPEYEVTPAPGVTHGIGKPIFVYRDLGDDNIMPVPMTDYSHELYNQKHEFWQPPWESASYPYLVSEKVAFFRKNDSLLYVRVYPIPEEVRTYVVTYVAGELDWDETDITDIPIMPEWSGVRTVEAAAFLLPHAEWEGYTRQENMLHRKEISAALAPQIQDHREEFNGYIRNPQHEPMTDSGYWWE